MTDADKVMNPQHFERDPADIRIRMRMNPAIRIGISDHFWTLVEMLALAKVWALWAQSCYYKYTCLTRLSADIVGIATKKWTDQCLPGVGLHSMSLRSPIYKPIVTVLDKIFHLSL